MRPINVEGLPWPPTELAGLGRLAWRVADVLRLRGPSTRADLVAATGFSRATVSTVVRDLLDEGWASESGTENTTGRPAAVVRLERRAGLAMGVDIGRRHIRIVIVDAGYRQVNRDSVVLDEDADDHPALVLEEAALLATTMVRDAGADMAQLIGVGLGIPAPMTLDGRIGSSTWLPEWADILPGERFTELLDGVRVKAENDATLGAFGEYVFGESHGSRKLVYVKAATGIGAGFVIDGHMYRGAAGTAGEIGHITLNHEGAPCRCGNRGCLELYAGGAVILRQANAANYFPSDLSDLVKAAVAGDHLAQNLIREAGKHIGTALGTVVNLHSPDRILVGGELSAAGEILLQEVRNRIKETAMPTAFAAVNLGLAHQRSWSTAMGGAANVLRSQLTSSPA